MIAWAIYITFAGAVLLLLLPRAFARWIALVTTIAGLALGLIALVRTPCAESGRIARRGDGRVGEIQARAIERAAREG